MRAFILIVSAFVMAAAGADIAASGPDFLAKQKFMGIEEIRKRWGTVPFSAEKFKAAATKQRAEMAYDLVKKKSLKGKSVAEVKALLGETSGYFWTERVPTYFIEEGWATKGDSWQLVFLVDNDERVTDIRVHKNCCDFK